MDYQMFVLKVKQELESRLDTGIQLLGRSVTKTNDIVHDGFTFVREGAKVSPFICLDNYYQAYLKGETPESIAGHILLEFEEKSKQKVPDLADFMQWDTAAGRIVPRVINTKKNEVYLRDIPSRPFLNLSVIYVYLIEGFGEGSASITVRKEHVGMWNISPEELDRTAFANMDLCTPPVFCSLKDMMKDLLGSDMPGTDGADSAMYVLTNKEKSFGAAWVCRKDMLKKIYAKLKTGFLVLPSSVHECMIIADEHEPERYAQLAEIVREINMTQVEAGEILSDCVYRYSPEENALLLCGEEA